MRAFNKDKELVVKDGLALQAMALDSVLQFMKELGRPIDTKTALIAYHDALGDAMDPLCSGVIGLLLSNIDEPNYSDIDPSEAVTYADMFGVSLKDAITDYYLRHGEPLPEFDFASEGR